MSDLPSLSWGDPVDRDNRKVSDRPVICPFTVIVDSREQAPWSFQGMRSDAHKEYRPLVVFNERQGLPTGDYSMKGFEDQITIERKSLADAFSTFTVDRDRFTRELERMKSFRYAAVVIEAPWESLICGPKRIDRSEEQSRIIGKTCYRSILYWSQRFLNVHWFLMPCRMTAERTCFRLLECYWKDREYERKQSEKEAKLEAMKAEQLRQGSLI